MDRSKLFEEPPHHQAAMAYLRANPGTQYDEAVAAVQSGKAAKGSRSGTSDIQALAAAHGTALPHAYTTDPHQDGPLHEAALEYVRSHPGATYAEGRLHAVEIIETRNRALHAVAKGAAKSTTDRHERAMALMRDQPGVYTYAAALETVGDGGLNSGRATNNGTRDDPHEEPDYYLDAIKLMRSQPGMSYSEAAAKVREKAGVKDKPRQFYDPGTGRYYTPPAG